MKNSTSKVVVIEVSGGIAEVTACPEGVEVEIIDHDDLDREPQSHGPLCASRACGECTCGEFERMEAIADEMGVEL